MGDIFGQYCAANTTQLALKYDKYKSGSGQPSTHTGGVQPEEMQTMIKLKSRKVRLSMISMGVKNPFEILTSKLCDPKVEVGWNC